MAQESKRGPGRPKEMVARKEVWHSPESLKDLECWEGISKEAGNHGAAIRRLLAVVRCVRETKAGRLLIHEALEETKP